MLVGFLERLALAESPSTEPGAQNEVLDILSEALIEIGYAVCRLPGRWSGGHIYARPRGSTCARATLARTLRYRLAAGTLEEMPVEVRDDVVKGPGVYDMKGGLAQMVFALRAMRDLDLSLPYTPIVFVNSDEEVGSKESDASHQASRTRRREGVRHGAFARAFGKAQNGPEGGGTLRDYRHG